MDKTKLKQLLKLRHMLCDYRPAYEFNPRFDEAKILEIIVEYLLKDDTAFCFQMFSDLWLAGLNWPADIERPEPRKEAA